jgi:hypothetical protein
MAIPWYLNTKVKYSIGNQAKQSSFNQAFHFWLVSLSIKPKLLLIKPQAKPTPEA